MTIGTICITIDGKQINAVHGQSIIEAAWGSGIYIPSLCAHPDLSPTSAQEKCGLCFVECDGMETVMACTTKVKDGMTIKTVSARINTLRKINLSKILASHPHVCLTCPQRDGCDRTECTFGIIPEERCCERFGQCEVQQVSDYIGIPENTPAYHYHKLPIWNRDPVIYLNLNRCIGCQRCVDVCSNVMGYNVLTPFNCDSLLLVKPKASLNGNTDAGFKTSQCKFCGACVEVCPAGAILECGPNGKRWIGKAKSKLNLTPMPLPPRATFPFNPETIKTVPNVPGIYRLWDREGMLFLIEGTPSLRQSLEEKLAKETGITECNFEEVQMYTQRVNELLAAYLQEHGKLPKGNDLDDDLF